MCNKCLDCEINKEMRIQIMLSIDELHYRRVSFEGDENNERKSHRFFRGNPHDNIMTTIRMCTMISLNAFITSVTRK